MFDVAVLGVGPLLEAVVLGGPVAALPFVVASVLTTTGPPPILLLVIFPNLALARSSSYMSKAWASVLGAESTLKVP